MVVALTAHPPLLTGEEIYPVVATREVGSATEVCDARDRSTQRVIEATARDGASLLVYLVNLQFDRRVEKLSQEVDGGAALISPLYRNRVDRTPPAFLHPFK